MRLEFSIELVFAALFLWDDHRSVAVGQRGKGGGWRERRGKRGKRGKKEGKIRDTSGGNRLWKRGATDRLVPFEENDAATLVSSSEVVPR